MKPPRVSSHSRSARGGKIADGDPPGRRGTDRFRCPEVRGSSNAYAGPLGSGPVSGSSNVAPMVGRDPDALVRVCLARNRGLLKRNKFAAARLLHRTVKCPSVAASSCVTSEALATAGSDRESVRRKRNVLLDLEILRRRFAAVADNLELDLLTLVEGAQPSPFDS